MTSKTISAENLGPISALEFALESPGVTVLVAPNGSGKSILLEAVQAAARGEGKLPLRDRTKRGKVEAFGATITIGGTCRHTGAFEVTNLEGRFDLAGLVDPRIKSPPLADKARIKALVSLTGVEASVTLFKKHEAFQDFGEVVSSGAVETDDLCEMAAKIKDDYDKAALMQERYADRETGQASALIPPADLDMDAESDQDVLEAAYNEARDVVTRLKEQAANAERDRKRRSEAGNILETLAHEELIAERETLNEQIKDSEAEVTENLAKIEELRRQAMLLKGRNDNLTSNVTTAKAKLEGIARQLVLVQQASESVMQVVSKAPTDEEMDEAISNLQQASQATQRGVLIRNARADEAKAASHKKAAKLARDKAAKYRDAGKATDDVLSGCIKCDRLRIESDGKAARLVSDTERSKSTLYHDLSDGEKWTIAIDIGADQVGQGGLLVISQVGWEGIDGANRHAIHNHAVQRGVYILTAEAASDPEATKEIKPTLFGDSEPIETVTKPAETQKTITVKKDYTPKPKAAELPPGAEDKFEDVPF